MYQPVAHTLQGQRFKIYQADIAAGGQPGRILSISKELGDRSWLRGLSLKTVQPAGKPRWLSFLNGLGRSLSIGDVTESKQKDSVGRPWKFWKKF